MRLSGIPAALPFFLGAVIAGPLLATQHDTVSVIGRDGSVHRAAVHPRDERLSTTRQGAPARPLRAVAVGDQLGPMAVDDGQGGLLLAWEDYRTGTADIYARALDGNGTGRWQAVALCIAAGDQGYAAIASDGAGGAIVAWEDARSGNNNVDIYVQRIRVNGTVAWTADGVALCTASGDQDSPAVVSDGAGGAIVTWEDARNGNNNFDVFAQRILADGTVAWTTNGVALCTASGDQGFPTIVSDGAGGAIVTWDDFRSGTSFDIYAQRIQPGGTVAWTADGVALCTAPGDQGYPTIASDGAAGAIVTWDDFRSGTSFDIYARRIRADGTVAWAANGVAMCAASGDQAYQTIVPDGAGGAIVTWDDLRSVPSDYDVYAQRVGSDGTVAWTPNGVGLCITGGEQRYPLIVADGAGGAIVTWEDARAGVNNHDIFAQRVRADGTMAWTANGVGLCTADGEQGYATIVPDGSNGAFVAWEDDRSSPTTVYAAHVTATGSTAWPPNGITSVLISLESAEAEAGLVRITWYSSEPGIEATVYRAEQAGEWAGLASIAADGTGRLSFDDASVLPGHRYGFRLGVSADGGERYLGEVWVTTPARAELSLEGLRPNPAVHELVAAFSLGSNSPATLELLDMAGRRVVARRLAGLSAGNHVVRLDDGALLAPGLYVIRLSQEGRTVSRKAVITR